MRRVWGRSHHAGGVPICCLTEQPAAAVSKQMARAPSNVGEGYSRRMVVFYRLFLSLFLLRALRANLITG